MKKIIKCFFIFLFSSMIFGCATITHKTKQPVQVNSDVPGAVATVHGQAKTTPATFYLKGSSDGYDVTLNKEGYKPAVSHIDSSFRGWSAIGGNILWLVPGIIVDVCTGSAYELDKQLNVKMGSEVAVGEEKGADLDLGHTTVISENGSNLDLGRTGSN
jgi:hypothetical protein